MLRNFLFIIIFLTIQSCEKYDIRLNVSNKIDAVVYFVISSDSNFKENAFNTPFSKNTPSKEYVRKLLPYSSKRVPNFGDNSWIYYVKKSKSKRLNVYFFTENVILNNSWENIYENKLYVGHNEYDLEELEKINWEIIFNPVR